MTIEKSRYGIDDPQDSKPIAPGRAKKSYRKPELTAYGRLKELTRGGVTGSQEGSKGFPFMT
jgi:hypothetical protein